MELAQLLEQLKDRIARVTGAIEVVVGDINASVVELRLHYLGVMDLFHILRALANLKELVKSYGLTTRKPRVEAIESMLVLVVEVVETRKSTDLYHT